MGADSGNDAVSSAHACVRTDFERTYGAGVTVIVTLPGTPGRSIT